MMADVTHGYAHRSWAGDAGLGGIYRGASGLAAPGLPVALDQSRVSYDHVEVYASDVMGHYVSVVADTAYARGRHARSTFCR